MTEFEIGYLAGIIDGEGCISLHSRGSRPRPLPDIAIVSTNKELIEYIATLVGGGSVRIRETKPNWKQCFELRWRGLEDVHRICNLINGRVIIKREQVEVMLRFIKVRKSFHGAHISKHFPKKTFDEEFALMEKIRLLNQRGPPLQDLTLEQADFLHELGPVRE